MEKKNPIYKKKWFIAVAVIFIIGGIGTLSDKLSGKTDTPVQSAQQEEQLQKEDDQIDVATMEMTNDNIVSVLKELLPKYDDNITVTYEKTEDGMTLDVHYYDENPFSDESMVKEHTRNAVKVFEEFFKNPEVDKIWVWGETKFLDNKGNESKDVFANVALKRETADQINWKNFSDMVYVEYQKLYEIADGHYMHPGLELN